MVASLFMAGYLRPSCLQQAPRRHSSRLRGPHRFHPASCQLEPEAFRGEAPRPKRTARLEPSFHLSRDAALQVQLKALQHNHFPTNDAGIECMYRFAAIDPFARSRYFGTNLDLGQFERFRRIFYTPCFAALLNHTSHVALSSLEVAEGVWKARVLVTKEYSMSKEERVYEFTMTQLVGGKRDGYWLCSSLVCDGCDDRTLYGVI